MYDVDYFTNKFEAIPEESWCTGTYNFGDKRCAYGHCGLSEEVPSMANVPEARALRDLDRTRVFNRINDGNDSRYQQKTPKQRVLAALKDIKVKRETKV
jgi:hypothetical protein